MLARYREAIAANKRDILAELSGSGTSGNFRPDFRAAGLSRSAPAPTQTSVAALRQRMAAENERRRDWWREPVEGWPERLEIRSAVTGEVIVIYLGMSRPH